MKRMFSCWYTQMRQGRYDDFDFVYTLGDDEKKTFTNIMERLISNLDPVPMSKHLYRIEIPQT